MPGSAAAQTAHSSALPVALGQQQHRQRRVGARDDQEDVGVVEAAQYGVAARAPVAAVVQRADAEEQAGGERVDRAGDPAAGAVGERGQD